jgi:hypothetical protein
MYDKYTKGSNPVKYFVEKGLQRSAPGDKVLKRKVFQHYIEFCNEFGLAPESDQSFSRRLTDEFGFQYKRVRINGQPEYCWIDVELRQWKEEEKQALDNLEDFSGATKEVMK